MDEKLPPKSTWQARPDMSGAGTLTPTEVAAAKARRITAMHLQALEGNPLTADEVAMFEMFEREAWSHDRRLDYIRSLALAAAGK